MVWKWFKKIFSNGKVGQAKIITIILIAIMIIIVAGFIPLVTAGKTNYAIGLLEGQGYWVLASGECYPEDFIPCVNGTQSLGSDANRWKDLWLTSPTIYLGNVTISNSGSQIDIDGQLVLHDGGKVWMEIQPDLDYATVQAFGKPTQVYRGVHPGFSLPVYNNDNEELYVALDVPREWDGITNPIVHIHCYLPVGDGFDWYSPTGHTESVPWISESWSYDDNLSTYASCSVPGYSWSDPITFTFDTNNYDKIRFYADYAPTFINKIDIDAHYNNTWNDVYEGTYDDEVWIEKSLGDLYEVDSYRIRFYNSYSNSLTARLYETSMAGIVSGKVKLELGYCSYTPSDNDIVPESPVVVSEEVETMPGNYLSYLVNIPIDCSSMTACDELGIRLKRIAASDNELSGEVVITHIGIQFLRDKLGEITP